MKKWLNSVTDTIKTTSEWVISNLPENYEELTYVQPYCNCLNILLNKEKSKTEVINDQREGMIALLRAIRDEPKHFISRLKKIKYSNSTFEKAKKKAIFKDYMEEAIAEFVLLKMSRGGTKKTFGNSPKVWTSSISNIPHLAQRLSNVFICNKTPKEIIKTFNSKNSLIVCCSNLEKGEDQIELSGYLKDFHGKVVVTEQYSPILNKVYKEWNSAKKRNFKGRVVWKNF